MAKYSGLRNEKGSVFLATLVSLFIMTLVGGFIHNVSTQDLRYVNQVKKGTQAQFLAEAGLAKALSLLNTNFSNKDNSANFPLTNLGAGNYDAAITQTGGRVLVSCLGDVQGIQRTVSVEVAGPSPSALDYSLAGNSMGFTLAGQSSVTATGKIYSDTTISLNAQAGSSSISLSGPGNADAGGTLSTSGAGTITMGSSNPNSSLAGFPSFNFAYYQNIAQNGGGLYINGNQTYSTTGTLPSPAGRVIFVNGNLTISANQSTTAAIIATGNITITGGTTSVSPPSNYPALMTQNQPITLNSTGNSNPASLTATGLVYSGNNFSIIGNHHTITVNGLIAARGALTGNSNGFSQNTITVNYQAQNNLGGMTSAGSSPMSIRSYNR